MAFPLTKEQQVIVDNRGGSLLVSAAAGSGKTKVLVDRVLDLGVIRRQRNLDDFLIITFTKASAAELRSRILNVLNEKIATETDADILARLQAQTTRIYRAQISTIDSFCQSMVEEFGYLIGQAPDVQVMQDQSEGILKHLVLEQLLEEHYRAAQPEDGFSVMMDRLITGRDDKRLVEMVLLIHGKLQSDPNPQAWLDRQIAEYRAAEAAESVDRAQLQEQVLDACVATVQAALDEVQAVTGALMQDNVFTGKGMEQAQVLPGNIIAFLSSLKQGWQAALAAKKVNKGSAPAMKAGTNPAIKAHFTAVREDILSRLHGVISRVQDTEKSLTDAENLKHVAPAVVTLLELVKAFSAAYGSAKKERHMVDYSDLEHTALEILEAFPDVAQQMQNRFAEVMVDEYQDTNEVQNAIFNAITDGGRTLFMVGDIKQSIYRFRLADPTIFNKKLSEFPLAYDVRTEQHFEIAPGAPRKLLLTRNFRSRRSVLDATNFVFRGLMSRDFGEIPYDTPEHILNVGRPDQVQLSDTDDLLPDCPELHVLTVDEICAEEGKPQITDKEAESDYVAQQICRLVAQGACAYGDIAVLHRSLGAQFDALTAALRRHGVPYQHTGDHPILDNTEVVVAHSYLQILDNPHQDIPLIGVLRSPLYGLTVDELAQIRANSPDTDFYAAVLACAAQSNRKLQTFLAHFNQLRQCVADNTAGNVLWTLYRTTGLLDAFSLWEDAENRRKNLIAFYQYARQSEQGGNTLHDLLQHLGKIKETAQELKIKNTIGNGVKLMTVHGSKGLEFPVVFLVGLGHRFNTQDEGAVVLFHSKLGLGVKGIYRDTGTSFFTENREKIKEQLHLEMLAEELRLLYVAMTRAQEKLIMVSTVAKGVDKASGRNKKLLDLCKNAAYPMKPENLRLRSMGEWVISVAMTRPEGACLCAGAQPIIYADKQGCRWNIQLIENHTPPTQDAINAAPKETPATQALPWNYRHEKAVEIPARLSPSKLGHGAFAQAQQVPSHDTTLRAPDPDGAPERMTATDRGTAVHLFMQLCEAEKGATVAGVQEERERLVRGHFMTPQQAQVCAAEKVVAFFTSDLGALARRSEMHREYNFTLLVDADAYYEAVTDEQILVQGMIDLWFETEDGLVIVDFKTDGIKPGEESARAERYRAQLDVYGKALERITGKAVIRRYLWFTATDTAYRI